MPSRERAIWKNFLAKLENYNNLSKEMKKRVDEIVNRKIASLAEMTMESEF